MSSSAPEQSKIHPAKCQYPILLLHGFLGFARRQIGPFDLTYFRNVAPYLESVGNKVCTLEVHPTQTIAFRASQIARFIDAEPSLKDSPLNLVGHSMGGLDARYLASNSGLSTRIRSVTTLATPHHGSFLADILDNVPLLQNVLRKWAPAIHDLSEKSMTGFNQETPDHAGTHYLSLPASTRALDCTPFLWFTLLVLYLARGLNDGQVTVASARWGEVIEEVQADHVALIGMRVGSNLFRAFNHLEIYGKITQVLAERGM
jgi:triacylglycerol lipase